MELYGVQSRKKLLGLSWRKVNYIPRIDTTARAELNELHVTTISVECELGFGTALCITLQELVEHLDLH